MINKFMIALLLTLLAGEVSAQVGINTTDPQQALDVNGHIRVRNINQTGNGLASGSFLYSEADGTVVGLNPEGMQISNNTVNILGGRYYEIATVDVGSEDDLHNLDLDLDGDNKNVAVIILTGSDNGDIELTGISGGVHGRHIILVNDFNKKITVKNEDSDSDAENRIKVKTTYHYTNDNVGTMEMVYDGTSSRWIMYRLNK